MNSNKLIILTAVAVLVAAAFVVLPSDDSDAAEVQMSGEYQLINGNPYLVIDAGDQTGSATITITGNGEPITATGTVSTYTGNMNVKLDSPLTAGTYTATVEMQNGNTSEFQFIVEGAVDPETYTIDATGASNVEIGYTGDVTNNTVAANAPLTITVSAIENYTLQSVTVTMDDEELTPVVEEGVYTYTIEAVTGNIVIVAATTSTGGADEPYSITIGEISNGTISVTNAADGSAVTNETQLTGEVDLIVTVTPGVENVTSVTVNGQAAEDNGDGTYTRQITVTGETSITAVIETEETQYWDVTFVVNGETVDTIQVEDEQLIPDAEVPSIPDENFLYWSIAENGAEYDFNDPVTEDITLYAVFDEIVVDPSEPVVIQDGEHIAAGSVLNGTVTIPNGSTVYVDGDFTVSGNLYLYGRLVLTDGVAAADVTVTGDGTFKAFRGSAIQAEIVAAAQDDNATIDLADAMEIMNIDNNVASSNTYSQTQIVVITETLNLRAGTTTTILGQLQVNEGVTLTIEDGATLVIDSQTAQMIVDGTIEVEDGAAIYVYEADDVTVSGTIESNGTVYINSTVTIKENGTIVIDNADGSSIEVVQGLTVENGGSIEIMGLAKIADIANKGTVVLDGAILNGDVTISMAADGAVVEVRSFTSAAGGAYALTVTDAGLEFKAATSSEPAVVVTDPNSVTVPGKEYGGIRNLTISESVTSVTENRQTTYYNHMALSGSISIADETVDADTSVETMGITVSGPSIDVTGELVLGKGITMTLADGAMNVTGTVTAVQGALNAGDAHSNAIDINVTGTVTVRTEIRYNINAFQYEQDVEDGTNYVYTTLGSAVGSGADMIYAFGDNKVLEDVTVPAGTQVRPGDDPGTITIGDGDNRNVTVTVEADGQIRSCTIDVYGTLYFADKGDQKNNTIYSDVSVIGEVDATYTNIYTALAGAEAGDVVTITRTNGPVVLDSDITVPVDVVLEVPANYSLMMQAGVTMTVDGTVKNFGAVDHIYADTGVSFAPEAADTVEDQTAAIIVNGLFMQMTDFTYSDYYIAGAYYNLVNSEGNWYYAAPVETAAEVSNDVTSGQIAIFGENTVGDVTFTGDESQPVYVCVMPGDVNYDAAVLMAGTVTLSNARIAVLGVFDGSIATSVGSVDVVNATYFSVESYMENEQEVMDLAGTPTIGDVDGADPAITVATGTVTVATTLNLDSMDYTSETLEFDGSFTIASGAELVVSGRDASLVSNDLTVEGALTAYDGGLLDIDTVTVEGTLTVSPADSENGIVSGRASIGIAYVGITDRFGAGTAATVSADAITGLAKMFVSADSTVSEKLVDSMRYSTEFYVEDSLWMTAYANAGSQDALAGIQPSDLTNSVFEVWQYDNNGTPAKIAENSVVGSYPAVYAQLNYDIYVITVFADPGIDAVYIDGRLMTSGYFSQPLANGEIVMAQGFQSIVAAGNHEITYKLGAYFSGEAQMTVNGEAVSGNTFTASGVPETGSTVEYVIYLQGIQADTPSTPVVSGDGDDGLGLTEILLIILVVLIVIMAIIVALRLMRS